MRSDRPSATAYRVAMARAAHQILDQPLVLDDPLALRIVGAGAEASIRSDPRRHQSGSGSSITFDYMLPPRTLPFVRRLAFYWLARRVAAAGEPWQTWFDSAELARELRALGFTRLEDLDSEALSARYIAGRAHRLGGRNLGRVIIAMR